MSEENESKELTKIEQQVEDAIQKAQEAGNVPQLSGETIANIISYINDDRDKADEAYNYFKNKIEMDHDNRSATREAITKSLEIRNRTIDQLLKFLEIQAKVAISKAESSKPAGLTVNVFSGEVKIDKRTLIGKIDRGEI